MKLAFLGTRGYIKPRSPLHYMHSSCSVSYGKTEVIIDWGADWLDQVGKVAPKAIVITHAHPDHCWGLKKGVPCPVYATAETWEVISNYDVTDRRIVVPREPFRIKGITFEAFPVVHSTRAPAVGYRITAGAVKIFYVTDVVYIEDRAAALAGINAYVGDGATILRSMVRKPGDTLVGHTPIRTQLTWCSAEGVPRAIFTHCGTEIVAGDDKEVRRKVKTLGEERGVSAELAFDGMEVVLR